jgi:hypothetical protein
MAGEVLPRNLSSFPPLLPSTFGPIFWEVLEERQGKERKFLEK